ncbi:hypothetical protein AIJ49_13895 [Salmonella enterica subsp. enterica serovar Enteritidis]|nr:hypothetical protein AIJ49_13895 [Salmonella enterica subsp. enterica serovar Enteritidis]
MVVFYKKIRSEGKKSTERKSDKYGMDKARWHQDVQAVKAELLTPIKTKMFICRNKKYLLNIIRSRRDSKMK